jgi:phosphoribosylformylglycinamidine synthase
MDALREGTLKDARTFGLKEEEFQRILNILGRTPNLTELGIFSVLWSEHCSYKSSRIHLKKFPTTGKHVLQGPGENAGIIDIGDGLCVVFKMESHNHPSYIEPFQGAATGVGGILRDIFTMGARPIACMDSLRFGAPDAPRMKYLVHGVVAGIGFYGNCFGVPTVGGETTFFEAYNENILVNAFTLGIAKHGELFFGKASGVGNPVYYVGSKTGKDGIHGATMASEEFSDETEEKRPTVQVGDPFTEKLLLEALLELMKTTAIEGIQDMGAAGLTSSSFEMAGRAGTGMRLDLDAIPLRESDMNPYEMMLSESQERMLIVARKGQEQVIHDVFGKWDLDAVRIGEVTADGRVTASWRGGTVVDLPVAPLTQEAPLYNRPARRPAYIREVNAEADLALTSEDFSQDLKSLLNHPNFASKQWVWRQYDHQVRTNTVLLPGLDAALLRVKGTRKGIALTSDINPLWCYLDPRRGAMHAVAEGVRNLACVGAKGIGVTDCLNFGNPEKPGVMWQFKEAVEGMAKALKAFKIPVVSGNVSFYNDTEGRSIWPTPTVAMVGLVDNIARIPVCAIPEGVDLFLAGGGELRLAGSQYAYHRGLLKGRIPEVDLKAEKALQKFLLRGYRSKALLFSHDLSEGGFAVALAEFCLLSRLGFEGRIPEGDPTLQLFGEGGGRALVAGEKGVLEALAAACGLPLQQLGTLRGERLNSGPLRISLAELRQAWETGFEGALGG